ncbi:MAG: SDR family NAD(P)-dependent oxidoreductase [Pseudomonadota bacterium]
MNAFSPPSSAAVIGASGGIGGAVARLLNRSPQFDRVYSFARRASDGMSPIDITDEASVAAAAQSIDVPLDLVFVATGILYTDEIRPEKSMRQIDGSSMLDVFAVNAVGPTLVAKHFLPRLRKDSKSVFAALSARVGSIGDNRLGGWISYRSSKAALNMAIKTLAIEHRRSHPASAVIGLHPGTVDTELSAPFQRGVPDGKLFTPDYSAECLLGVIDEITAADSGRAFAWDGAPIEP